MKKTIFSFHVFLNIAIMMIFIVLFLFCAIFYNNGHVNPVDGFIFLFSLTLLLLGIISMEKQGIKIWNLFTVVYFVSLILNTFNISRMQNPKTWYDAYIFLAGAVVLIVMMYLGDSSNIKITNARYEIFSPNTMAILVTGVYTLGKMYIYLRKGIPLFSKIALYDRANFETLALPGVSGVVTTLGWIALMFIPHTLNILKVMISGILILTMGILDFNRGSTMRIFLFLLIYFVYSQKNKIITKRNVIVLLALLLILISLFTIMGERREGDDGRQWSTIVGLTRLKINSTMLGWLYGYTALNFDVLKLYADIASDSPLNSPTELMQPFIRFTDSSQHTEDIEFTKRFSLGAFNASTFFRGFVKDYGTFYVFELLIFSIILAIIIFFAKARNMLGTYVFLLMQTSMAMFGNYYIALPPMFIALFLSFFIFFFVKTSPQKLLVQNNFLHKSTHKEIFSFEWKKI